MCPPEGGQIGANRDEQEGVGKGGGTGAGEEWRVAGRGRGGVAAGELPTGEAAVEAIWGGRCRGVEAPQRRAAVEPGVRGEVPAESLGPGAGEVRRAGGGAFRPDAGSGALGVGGRAARGCRDAAAVDAGGRVVEPRAEAAATPAKTRSQGALWGDGADGRELPPLAGGAGPGRLSDGPGRRRHEHHAGALGGGRDDLGRGGGVAGLDRALRGAGGLIRGLEESVQAVCHGAGGAERGRADHAVWAHVREAGDRVDRGQFAAGQGAGGADSRDASGPAGEEAATAADRHPRPGQRLFGGGVSAGTQSPLCAPGRPRGGLSPAGAGRGGVGQDLPSGERAGDQRRLGGGVRQPVFPARARESPLCAGAGQSGGLRVVRGAGGDRVSRSRGAVARDPGPRPARPPRGEAGGQASYGTDSAHREAEMGAVGGSPVATGGPPRRGEASVERDGGDAAVVGLALRFALNAPPYGLRRASLRARPTTRTRTKTKNKKRDISNEVRKGTFLKSFDRW